MITSSAGLSGYINHSLCATAVSRMYNSGVPEKIITEKSGHRSLSALRSYKNTEEELYKEAEQSIVDPDKKFQMILKLRVKIRKSQIQTNYQHRYLNYLLFQDLISALLISVSIISIDYDSVIPFCYYLL